MHPTRRQCVGGLATSMLLLPGCSSGDPEAKSSAEVVVGPDARLTFDPARLTVSTGETVSWYFDSEGHNVSGVPDHHDAISIPPEATGFSSYDGENTFATRSKGSTYSHTFTTPGVYTYVCVPHAPEMEGEIEVTE